MVPRDERSLLEAHADVLDALEIVEWVAAQHEKARLVAVLNSGDLSSNANSPRAPQSDSSKSGCRLTHHRLPEFEHSALGR